MKLGNLKSVDTSFLIIKGEADLEVAGITDCFELTHHHFVFVKNKNFLNDWLDKNKKPKSTGVVFGPKKF